jgi:hypothetical protein
MVESIRAGAAHQEYEKASFQEEISSSTGSLEML